MHPIVLYDGVCVLCNRLVQFILRRDQAGAFRFATLQSPAAAQMLACHGENPGGLETVYVVLNHGESKESLLPRSDAVLFIFRQLGGIWQAGAIVLRLIPRPLRDGFYRLIARYRHRVFGRYDACPLPSEDTRDRFIDL